MFIRDFSAIYDQDGLIYTVRCNQINAERIRCCLIYVPTKLPSFKETKEGVRYLKIPDESGYTFLRANMSHKLFTDIISQDTFPAILPEGITKVIDPVEKLNEVLKLGEFSQLTEFVNILTSHNIERKCIGLFGSIMLDFIQKKMNDIDIIIYGKDNHKKYMRLADKLSNLGYYPVSNSQTKQITSNSAMANAPIGFDLMYPIIINRQKFGLVKDGTRLSIKFSYLPEETRPILRFPPLEETRIEGEVVDDNEAFFLPYTYKVIANGRMYTIQTLNFAYFSAAFAGQRVSIFGTLKDNNERDIITLSKPYHYISPKTK